MTLNVLHVDNHVLVVEKPACLPCVPDDSGDESLLDRAREWVRVEFDKPGNVFLGVVHRLDRPVSGVVLFARTSKAAARLTSQFREHQTGKHYLGVVQGEPGADEGELVQWLEKLPNKNFVVRHEEPRAGAKEARTEWRVMSRDAGQALLRLTPHTGRSHQLRVACASLGTPLLGDLKYGAPEALADRSIALHAERLEFEHPTRSERLAFQCAPPDAPWWALGRA